MMREVKLCLLGDTGVGKTSLGKRFVSDSFLSNEVNTVGASFLSKTVVVEELNRTFKYQIWDTAGQEKYRSLAPMYYRGAAAAIVVYDITRANTFEKVKHWIKELHQLGPRDAVIAIAGNKSDLEDSRQVMGKQAAEYAKSVNALFAETSAKTAVNVYQLFMDITKALPAEAATFRLRTPHITPTATATDGEITILKDPDKNEIKKGCC